METLEEIIEAREIDVPCWKCSESHLLSLGWLRGHRDLHCPSCNSLIVLNTAELRHQMRNVERQLRELYRQISQRSAVY